MVGGVNRTAFPRSPAEFILPLPPPFPSLVHRPPGAGDQAARGHGGGMPASLGGAAPDPAPPLPLGHPPPLQLRRQRDTPALP